MVGTPVVAAFVAHAAFWALLVYGSLWREVTAKQVVILVLLWFVARFGFPYVPLDAMAATFSPFVAALDIALVFMIFKGDVRLT